MVEMFSCFAVVFFSSSQREPADLNGPRRAAGREKALISLPPGGDLSSHRLLWPATNLIPSEMLNNCNHKLNYTTKEHAMNGPMAVKHTPLLH